MKLSHLGLILIMFPMILSANIINVPEDFESIQAGIDNAENRDTVLVQPGTYNEQISFNDKSVVVGSLFITTGDETYISQTIIDAEGEGRPVTFDYEEPRRPTLSGFTLTNGSTENGGGIYCSDYSPILNHLIITGNFAEADGGGMFCSRQTVPTLSNVTIVNNTAEGQGGGIYCRDSSGPRITNSSIVGNSAASGGGIYCNTSASPTLIDVVVSRNTSLSLGGGIACTANSIVRMTRVLIADNTAEQHSGGGIYMSASELELTNVTLSRNSTNGEGGGIFIIGVSILEITNSVLWGNNNHQVHSHGGPNPPAEITISYCDIDEGQDSIYIQGNANLEWLEGNINEDPLFVNISNYHLTQDSPCIDAGDPNSREDPDYTRADMGAFYFDPDYGIPEISNNPFPSEFEIIGNYPNPFNSTTTIIYQLPEMGQVTLSVYDLNGKLITTLFNNEQSIGIHQVIWNALDIPSGEYLYQLKAGSVLRTSKLILVK
ncbi:MAG: T9SS type A sorting domain-containing protein [Candidatus Hatepunaea meridiana]|nr:T9SS type A sorting domain-containing protein [Candidatus Hatepunaea meridiana]